MPEAGAVQSKSISTYSIALATCVVIGLAIRAIAASGAPWLDELWSWQIAAAGDVLVAHDNNHLLNTAWLWLVRDIHSPLIWRLPAVLSGGATILMAAILLRRFGRVHAVAGALLIAVCHPLVVYQSEARGYAMMLLCMLVAIELQLRLTEGRGKTRLLRLAMAVAATLGVLSQLSFAVFYAVLVLSSLLMPVVTGNRRKPMTCLLDHAGGLILIAVWYFGVARRMGIGGGPELATWDVMKDAVALTAGVDLSHAWWLILTVPAVIGLCALVTRQRSPQAVVLLSAVVLGYPLLVLLMKGNLIYVRYFLPAMVALLLLVAAALGETMRRGYWRPFATAAMGLLLCLHASQLVPLLHHGRDLHRMAIARMQEDAPASVGSDCDFQLRTILDYYRREAHGRAFPVVISPKDGPDWLIVMRSSGPARMLVGEAEYGLSASYKAHDLSGIPWMLYHRTTSHEFHSAQTRTE